MWQTWINSIRYSQWHRKFRNQLISAFIVMVLLPTVLIGSIFLGIWRNATVNRYEDQLMRDNMRVTEMFRSRVESMESLASSLVQNTTLKNYLTYTYETSADQIQDVLSNFRLLMQWLLITNTEVSRLHLLTSNDHVPVSSYTDSLTQYKGEPWILSAAEGGSTGSWIVSHEPIRFNYSMVDAERVASYIRRFPLGSEHFLMLDVDKDWLYGEIPYVVDAATGKIIYSAVNPQAVGRRIILSSAEKERCMARLNEEDYRVYVTAYDRLGILLVTAVAEAYVQREIMQTVVGLSCVILASMALAMIVNVIFVDSVASRMNVIKRNIGMIAHDQYMVEYKVKRKDEIDDLGHDVVILGQKMDHLVNQVLIQQMLTKDAELHALQAQMNPHFIFNMLETMAMMAEINDQYELSDVISQFGEMVRYNLDVSDHVPLERELKNIQQYVALQNLMHNDQLSLDIHIDPAAEQIEVPRLLLQPIVENAIVHGKLPEQRLLMEVCIEVCDKGYMVSVVNNGRQMQPEQVDQLNQDIRATMKKHVPTEGKHGLALGNIQHRLMLMFGEQCVLQLKCCDGWVKVWFLLPDEWRE